MKIQYKVSLLLLSLAALGVAGSALAQNPGANSRPTRRTTAGATTYYVTGSEKEADLEKLRGAFAKLKNIDGAEVTPRGGWIAVRIRGEGTISLMGAAARSVGYLLRPMPSRSFAATGPNGAADVARLREAIKEVPGVEQLAVRNGSDGIGVRVQGVLPGAAVVQAGKTAGFTLRQLSSYVVSGKDGEADLAHLREALGKVSGVENVELRRVQGGATILVQGDALEDPLVKAAAPVGYILRPLAGATTAREFAVAGPQGTATSGDASSRLQAAIRVVQGVTEAEVRSTPDGLRLLTQGASARTNEILAAGEKAGFELKPMEDAAIPSLEVAGERNTPPDYEERVLEEQAQVGQDAPDFKLLTRDGKRSVTLSSYRGAKPVVLVFGSYTCPPFRSMVGTVDRLYQQYKKRVEFLFVYTREAHPDSFVHVPVENGKKELRPVPQTDKTADRLRNLGTCMTMLKLTMPALVDSEDNVAKRAYASWPIRLYVVGADGKVAYKGRPGPSGFQVPELEAWLQENAN